jgi:hypothetical protein
MTMGTATIMAGRMLMATARTTTSIPAANAC